MSVSKNKCIKSSFWSDIIPSVWDLIMYKNRHVPYTHGDTVYITNGIKLLNLCRKNAVFKSYTNWIP